LISSSEPGFSNAEVIAEFFAGISGSNDAPHDFGLSRFGNIADEQNFLGSERFAKLDGERVF
jgi:hypothetical protein